MNIVLIGMRGCGKTTVGRILAQKLGREFVDMDELIPKKVGMSIAEIVEKHGWPRFRDIEDELAGEVAELDNIVNATGGGVITREKNIVRLKKNGVLVWLKANADALFSRTTENSDRPRLLKGRSLKEEIAITLAEREPLYYRAADFIIETENKTPHEVAEAIMAALKKVCCLIGDPVEHSLSPLIHNAGYQALGIDCVYLPFQAKDVRQAIQGVRALGLRGASVTIPYKVSAIRYLDEIDPLAREIGAVNTIVNEEGRLIGFNTDCDGALRALTEVTPLQGKKAVLVGSGGAASAIAVGLKKSGVQLTILNRTEDKARKLALRVNAEGYGSLNKLAEIPAPDILINATPVGMWPQAYESLIPKDLLHDGLTVFDVVYNPKETRLVAEARERGCAIVYGYKMFLYQAARQFELFTGQQAPLAVMESALTQVLQGGGFVTRSDGG